jgi:hypothetical protein
MNKQQTINKALLLTDNKFRKDLNSIRLNTHNSILHEVAKTIVAFKLIQDGHTIITEATFKNGCRADIFCLDTMSVYEVLASETEEEALTKVSNYPEEVEIHLIEADDANECLEDGNYDRLLL